MHSEQSRSERKKQAEEAWEAAQKALHEAQRLPGGAERIEALRRVGRQRFEADKLRRPQDERNQG